ANEALEYALSRMEEVALENALEALGAVHKELSTFCQELVVALHDLELWSEQGEGEVGPAGPGELLPGGARDLGAAAAGLLDGLGDDFLREFDERFQEEVLTPQGGLWKQLVGRRPGEPAGGTEVRAALRVRARAAILHALADVNAARLFLDAHPER